MNLIIPKTSNRISVSNSHTAYATTINEIISAAYTRTLDNMAADTNNLNIQEADLEGYIRTAVSDIVREYKDAGKIDPKFNIF